MCELQACVHHGTCGQSEGNLQELVLPFSLGPMDQTQDFWLTWKVFLSIEACY